jgi:small subunit ribosomal protein S13
MAIRIAGRDLPVEKTVAVGLTAIYGVGRKNAAVILAEAKIDAGKRIKELTAEEVTRLQKILEKKPTEGELRSQVSENIKRLKSIGSYRGMRHSQGLPVRGQRTRSNARTKRGKRRTVGALRKKEMVKLGVAGHETKEEKKEEK